MDIDLDGVTPNWEFLPPGVRSVFESAAGTALMIGLRICVIGFVVAGVRLLFARPDAAMISPLWGVSP